MKDDISPIKEKLIKIRNIQKKAANDLKKLQNQCTHPKVITEYCGSTGNYDPSDNEYWKEYKCPDCDKFWTEEQ